MRVLLRTLRHEKYSADTMVSNVFSYLHYRRFTHLFGIVIPLCRPTMKIYYYRRGDAIFQVYLSTSIRPVGIGKVVSLSLKYNILRRRILRGNYFRIAR